MFLFPLCFLVVYDLLVSQGNMLGPADLVFKRTEHCEPKCTTVDFWIDTRKYNRSISVLDITISNPYPIDDMVTGEILLVTDTELKDGLVITNIFPSGTYLNMSKIIFSFHCNSNKLIVNCLELKGSMKKEGGFKPGSFYYKDLACVALEKMLGDMFYNMLKITGVDKCPLPAGSHEVLEFYFDNEKFTVPQIWGEYKMEILIYKDEVLDGCYNIYYDMEPKN